MFNKLFIIAITIFLIAILSGCELNARKHDYIEVCNKWCFIFDDIVIDIKDGYFYDRHEKFTVDENTVAVTIFFVNENEDEWKVKE